MTVLDRLFGSRGGRDQHPSLGSDADGNLPSRVPSHVAAGPATPRQLWLVVDRGGVVWSVANTSAAGLHRAQALTRTRPTSSPFTTTSIHIHPDRVVLRSQGGT